MRVGIDVRYLSHRIVGGVHTYVACLVPALLRAAPDDAFFLYADAKAPFELDALPANAHLRVLPYRSPLSSVLNDLRMREWMAKDAIDVAHFPANYGFGPANSRTVITLHDAINLLPLAEIIRGHRKDARTIASMTYLHWQTVASMRGADLLITVSNFSKGEILKQTRFSADRIVPVTHGPSPQFLDEYSAEDLDAIRSRHSIHHPFVMADALKNPATLTEAWKQLPDTTRLSHRILFFSRRPDPPAAVLNAVKAGDAYLLVQPSFRDLIGLYHMAEAFAFPSLIEGLGLPILEAMQCGAPVIASDRGSIPEVCGGAALLADADDATTFSKHIQAVLTIRDLRDHLSQLGRKRAAQFTWDNTARRVMDIYRHAAPIPASATLSGIPMDSRVMQRREGESL